MNEASPRRRNRRLTERLGLAPDDLHAAGNWYPEEAVLNLLVDLAEEVRPEAAVSCGAGLAVPVIARALIGAGQGRLFVLENDPRAIDITGEMLAGIDAAGPVEMIEAELADYDKHAMWYNLHALGRLPDRIDLLFIDGPPHFAGRSPRWPAGPELFPRLSPGGVVVLDDARRAKEKKALERWAAEWPDLAQTDAPGGAAVLRRAA